MTEVVLELSPAEVGNMPSPQRLRVLDCDQFTPMVLASASHCRAAPVGQDNLAEPAGGSGYPH